MTLVLLAVERCCGSAFSIRALGGDPLLFQHLFWFYSHPAVYIMVLPAMGVVSEIIACYARNPIFGYRMMAYAILAIAAVGFLVWGHHMFVSGQSLYAGIVFSVLSFLVAIPSAIKVFNWTATLYKGTITLRRADAVRAGLRRPVHDRRHDRPVPRHAGARRAPHRHLLRRRALPLHHGGRLGLGLPRRHPFLVAEDHRPHVLGAVGALRGDPAVRRLQLHVLPAVPARRRGHAAPLPRIPAGVPDAATCCPRRAPSSSRWDTCCRSCISAGRCAEGAHAGANPHGATGLEWRTASPPPKHNFETVPVVDGPPYAYRAATLGRDVVDAREGTQ